MDSLLNVTMTSTRRRTAQAMLVAVMIVVAGARAEGTAEDPTTAPESLPEPACAVTVGGLPASILMPDFLVASLERMVQASATFRSQCNRIAGTPGVYIRVRVDRGMERRGYRARSVIHRAGSGAIVALVDIGPRGSPVEWIAHEFEHVIEQIDGVRLKVLERRGLGVWRSSGAMFETARAIRAGRAVAAEMRSGFPPGNKCVQ